MSASLLFAIAVITFSVTGMIVNYINRRQMERARDEAREATRYYLTFITRFIKHQRFAHQGALEQFEDDMYPEQAEYHRQVLAEIDKLDRLVMEGWDSMDFDETSPWAADTDQIDEVLAKWMREKE